MSMTQTGTILSSPPEYSTRPYDVVMLTRRPGHDLRDEWLARDQTISPSERDRIRAFRRWEDAMSSLLARRLMIDLVANSLGCEPATVMISREPSGRPVVTSACHDAVRVTAAHSGEWVAAAVSTRGRIGIDLEVARPVSDGLPERCCAPTERDWLRRDASADVAVRFFQLWTLKEAFLKAIGLGLAIDPRTLAVDISEHQPPVLRVAPDGIDPAEWRFVTWQALPGLWLAVATDGDLPTTYILNEDFAA
jgi:4'-phosphopantetheinyl transferase